MTQIIQRTENKSIIWSIDLRARVGDTVTHNSKEYTNTTGKNTEPGVGIDWFQISEDVPTPPSVDEKDIVNLIAMGKESSWGNKGATTLALTFTGTGNSLSSPSTSTTRIGGQNKRQQSSVVAAGNSYGVHTTSRYLHVSEEFYFRFDGMFSGNSDAAIFVGADPTIALIGNVEPSTLLDCIGIGKDSTDTNLQILHNDSSGLCTKIDLGSTFDSTIGNITFMIQFYSKRNESTIWYKATVFGDGSYVYDDTGWNELTTNIPDSTKVLAIKALGNRRLSAAGSKLMQFNTIRVDV